MKTQTRVALGVTAASAIACSAVLYFKFRCPYDFESEETRKKAFQIIAYEMGLYDIHMEIDPETGDGRFWLVPDQTNPYAMGERYYCPPEIRDMVLCEMDLKDPAGTITEDEVEARWIKLLEEVGGYRDGIWKDLKRRFSPPEVRPPKNNPNIIRFNPGKGRRSA